MCRQAGGNAAARAACFAAHVAFPFSPPAACLLHLPRLSHRADHAFCCARALPAIPTGSLVPFLLVLPGSSVLVYTTCMYTTPPPTPPACARAARMLHTTWFLTPPLYGLLTYHCPFAFFARGTNGHYLPQFLRAAPWPAAHLLAKKAEKARQEKTKRVGIWRRVPRRVVGIAHHHTCHAPPTTTYHLLYLPYPHPHPTLHLHLPHRTPPAHTLSLFSCYLLPLFFFSTTCPAPNIGHGDGDRRNSNSLNMVVVLIPFTTHTLLVSGWDLHAFTFCAFPSFQDGLLRTGWFILPGQWWMRHVGRQACLTGKITFFPDLFPNSLLLLFPFPTHVHIIALTLCVFQQCVSGRHFVRVGLVGKN